MEKWCVYIVECKDGSYYTGITKQLDKRMQEHKNGKGSKYVKAKGFEKLLGFKLVKNKSKAMGVEYKIKQLNQGKKLQFLNSY